MIKQWKNRIEDFAVENEHWVTLILVFVAVILLLIAVLGKPHHKAMALIYIVL